MTQKTIIAQLLILLIVLSGCSYRVSDICGNRYKAVKIGGQIWLAENMRCSKYDTCSEAFKSGMDSIYTSERGRYTPYYTDAGDVGFLYNWPAAVGLQTDTLPPLDAPFEALRQGVCPNGWHIPSNEEWKRLVWYIEKSKSKGDYTAGKHLKAKSGWHDDGKSYKEGRNTYRFNALPTGYSDGKKVENYGEDTWFWTSTPDVESRKFVYSRTLSNKDDAMLYSYSCIEFGRSVRCVKD